MGPWTRNYPIDYLNWTDAMLLVLRRMKRSGGFLEEELEPNKINRLIRSFKASSKTKRLILDSQDLDTLDAIIDILWDRSYYQPVTWKEYASLNNLSPAIPAVVWKDEILKAIRGEKDKGE